MIDYKDVDAANRLLDQQDDFHLDTLEDESEKEEAANRNEEYQRIVLFLAGFMSIKELSGIAARFMNHWESDKNSYYMDGEDNESLFYRGFEITRREPIWRLENEDDQAVTFFNADLMSGLKTIDGFTRLQKERN